MGVVPEDELREHTAKQGEAGVVVFKHGAVEDVDSALASDGHEPLEQPCPDAVSLPGIDDLVGELGSVRSVDHVAGESDSPWRSAWTDLRDQQDVSVTVHVEQGSSHAGRESIDGPEVAQVSARR
jgi:hypothetical protein